MYKVAYVSLKERFAMARKIVLMEAMKVLLSAVGKKNQQNGQSLVHGQITM